MILRALEPEDLELLYTIENDPDLWDVAATATPYSRHALRQHIRTMGADITESGELRFVIDLGEESLPACPIGLLDLTHYDARSQRAEVSIALLREHRGKGYARQALDMLEHHCRRHLHIHQLYALVPAPREASHALFLSAGYTPSALLPDWHFANGAYQNVQLYTKILRN